VKKADPDTIISAAARYAKVRNPGFGKMPQGWLNDERWNDEVVATERPGDDYLKSWGIPDAQPERDGGGASDTDPADGRQSADVSDLFREPDTEEPKGAVPVDHGGYRGDSGSLPPLRLVCGGAA